jgi:putative tricarboxylic transport membrane protein
MDGVLFPIIMGLCFIGSFALANSAWNMLIALIFGIIGYIMRKNGFPAAPVILGVIRGPIAEDNLGRALMSAYGDWTCLVQSPISLFFYAIALISIIYSLRRKPGDQKGASNI